MRKGGGFVANEDIRNLINNRRLKYWEIAKEYGTTDSSFSRLLRTPLSDDNKKKILDIIEKFK